MKEFPFGAVKIVGVGLPYLEMVELKWKGRITTTFSKGVSCRLKESESSPVTLICFPSEAYYPFWKSDFSADEFKHFLKHSYISTATKENPTELSLFSEIPLFNFLCRMSKKMARLIPEHRKSELKENGRVFHFPVDFDTIDSLKENGSIFQRISVCPCGEIGCGSEYVWIEKNLCRFYLFMSAAGIKHVNFFPFKIGKE